jgi:hypothetical protein
MKKLVLSALLLALISASASADQPGRKRSRTTVSPNGQYVFVMIAPLAPERDADAKWWKADVITEIKRIRETYKVSGLYRNDGSREPLWTVDWYASYVEVVSDGVHLVRFGPWAHSPEQEALTFFASGKEIRSYTIGELVAEPDKLPHSVSHFVWEKDIKLDDANLLYRLTTKNGEQYVFDITTGAIVSQSQEPTEPPAAPLPPDRRPDLAILAVALLVLGLICLLVLGFVCWYLLKARRRSPAPPSHPMTP